jgi:predicted acylesterase/phospholipase RssA
MQNDAYETLVLSGGSVRCLVTLGALQYATDYHLLDHLQRYVGTSAGALISYLLCIGYTPIEILVYVCTHRVLNLFESVYSIDWNVCFTQMGILGFDRFESHLKVLTERKFDRLLTLGELYNYYNKELIVTTYNYTHRHVEYLTPHTHPTLPCLKALEMSCALPLLFKRCVYQGCEYIDGGIGGNVPMRMTRGRTWVVWVRGEDEDEDPTHPTGTEPASVLEWMTYIHTLIQIPLDQLVERDLQEVTPDTELLELTSSVHLLNFSIHATDMLEMFSYGYQHAQQFFRTKSEAETGTDPATSARPRSPCSSDQTPPSMPATNACPAPDAEIQRTP